MPPPRTGKGGGGAGCVIWGESGDGGWAGDGVSRGGGEGGWYPPRWTLDATWPALRPSPADAALVGTAPCLTRFLSELFPERFLPNGPGKSLTLITSATVPVEWHRKIPHTDYIRHTRNIRVLGHHGLVRQRWNTMEEELQVVKFRFWPCLFPDDRVVYITQT